MRIEYQPKGGMCATCLNKSRDCSRLPFAAMPHISRHDAYGERTIIVRCTEFSAIKNDSYTTKPINGKQEKL